MSKNKSAKQLAAQQGISYVEALRRVRQQHDLDVDFYQMERVLPEGIAGACWGIAGRTLASGTGVNSSAGLDFGDVEVPEDLLYEIEVKGADPEMETLVSSLVQVYPDGEELHIAEVEAEVTFVGWGDSTASCVAPV